jgi:hypothetical protein
MEEDTQTNVTSLEADVMSIILAKLTMGTANALATVSQSINEVSKRVEKDVIYWEQRIKNITGLPDLPFEPTKNKVEYWKKLAISLDGMDTNINVLLNLYKTGQYEYVYIAFRLGFEEERYIPDVLEKAIDSGYNNSVKFILERKQLDKDQMVFIAHTAIKKDNNDAFAIILPLLSRDDVFKNQTYSNTSSLLHYSVDLGTFDSYKLILDTYPLKSSEIKLAKSLLGFISDRYLIKKEGYSPIKFLEYFIKVHKEFDQKLKLTYYVGYYSSEISKEEISAIISSSLFTINVLDPRKVLLISPGGAYLLYTLDRDYDIAPQYILNPDRVPSPEKESLLNSIIYDAELLANALEYAKPISGATLLLDSLKVYGNACKVVLDNYKFTKDEITNTIRGAIHDNFEVKTVKFLCVYANITQSDVEVMIMEVPSSTRFTKKAINSILSLGVKLSRSPSDRPLIGEKIAFNSDLKAWKILQEEGLDFRPFAFDLLIASMKDDYSSLSVGWLFEFLKEGDRTIVNVMYPRENFLVEDINTETLDYTRLFMDSVEKSELLLASRYLGHVIEWRYVTDYSWLDSTHPTLANNLTMRIGIVRMKKALENKILRYYDDNHKEDFKHWLICATMFQEPVTVTTIDYYSVITIGDTIIKIGCNISTKGKYKGLDLFSTYGEPLTTKEQIKARRAELQRMYQIRTLYYILK